MGAAKPRVTVFMPTYNRAHWLKSSIASVLDQTYEEFALVVADNASTDETAEVVKSFDDPRLTYIRREENVGLLENHNRCLATLDTEYCLILPDDDLIYPKLLAQTVRTLDEHPTAGMVHCGFDMIDESGEMLRADTNWTLGLITTTRETGKEFIRRSMQWSCRVCASTSLMRTAALPKGFFSGDDFPAVDLGMWLRMALDWDMLFLAERLGAYRIHGHSHSAAFGPPVGFGYVQEAEIVARLRDVKRRFLQEHAHRLGDLRELWRLADRAYRRELLVMVRNSTLPELKFTSTVRGLREAARIDARVPLQREAARMLVASALGPRLRERLKSLR